MTFKLRDVVSTTTELAALPSTTLRLLELLEDTSVGVDKVLGIISKDPSLTANLLKLCNSAYYGLRRKVGTVREALVMLGNKTVITLAFATSMGEVFRGQLSGYQVEKDQLWHHALATAQGASYLVGRKGQEGLKERAFTAGLVHDIGKLVLNRFLLKEKEQVPANCDSVVLLETESRILGFDHCEAGAALAEAWSFPPMMVEAVRCHHGAEATPGDIQLVSAVAGANLVATAVGFGGGCRPLAEDDLVARLAELGIPEGDFLFLLDNLGQEVQDLLTVVESPSRTGAGIGART